MRIKKLEKILLLLIIIKGIVMTFFTPFMEFPDSNAHINRILFVKEYKTNLTYILMRIIYSFTNKIGLDNSLNYELITEKTSKVLQNIPCVKYTGYTPPFILLGMLLQLFIVIISLKVFSYILKKNKYLKEEDKNKYFRMALLYYSTMSIGSLMLNITQDYFVYIFQPFYIYFLYEKKYLKAFIISFVLLAFVDNAALSNIIFLIFYIYFFYLKKIIKNKKLYIILSILTIVISYLFFFPIVITFNKKAVIHKIYNDHIGSGKLYTKIGGMILSSLYLGGANSFITFKCLYIVYILILLFLIVKILLVGKELPEIFSIVATISALLYLIRNLGHIKYATFIIIFIILFTFKYLFYDEKFKKNKVIFNFALVFFFLSIYETLKMFCIVYVM